MDFLLNNEFNFDEGFELEVNPFKYPALMKNEKLKL